jgi:hypothetical protein
MRYNYQSLTLSNSQRLWLSEIFKGNDSRRKIRAKLWKQIECDFDPNSIDQSLFWGAGLSLIGLWYIDSESALFEQVDTLIKSIREQIFSNPDLECITSEELSKLTEIPQEDVKLALYYMGQLGHFFSSASGKSDKLGYTKLDFSDEKAFDDYVRYKSLDQLLEERFNSMHKDKSPELVSSDSMYSAHNESKFKIKKGYVYDAFICHASEDKEAVVHPLVRALAHTGLSIWYDEFSLKLGDSLRQSIEHGLAQSRYGIVIISPHFFEKDWPQVELNGLFAKEITGEKVIIPIWFNIEYADIVKQSPIMADKFAARMSDGLDRVIEQILDLIEPSLLHLSKDSFVATLEPKNFRLQSGNWSIKTSVIVSNRSERNLYALSIKLAIEGGNFKAEDIEVLHFPKNRLLGGQFH